MPSIIHELDQKFRAAITAALGIDADPIVGLSQNEKFGDYQSNAAMGLAKGLDSPILLSSVTHEAARDLPDVEFFERGSHPVKGRLGKVRVYEARARETTLEATG